MPSRPLSYTILTRLPPPAVAAIQRLVARSHAVRRVVRRLSGGVRSGPQTIARGPAAGLTMELAGSRPSYLLGAAEPELVDWLAQTIRRGDVVLDLGANVGYVTLVAAALTGPDGRVVAFEPLPDNVRTLRRNVGLNGLAHVEVVEAAVSDAAGGATLSVGASDQEATLDARAGARVLEVETTTVDLAVAARGLAPRVVKIDVEGAELAVLRGMATTLREARPRIVCELHDPHPRLDHPAAQLLRAAGYDVAWLEPGDAEERRWAAHVVATPR